MVDPSLPPGMAQMTQQPLLPTHPLVYEPLTSRHYRPPLGLIGCGGITSHHLEAYRADGYSVVALCDLDRTRAELRQQEYYPDATVYTDYRDLLRRDEIEVVDITTHPAQRVPLIHAALQAGKHVLSQKPFVLDLDTGERLIELADRNHVQLAVNQNGRWAPHFSYMRAALAAGWLGTIESLQMSVQWDHTWIANTPFEQIHHLVLYDFAIHWFDMVTCLMGIPEQVYASVRRSPTQTVAPPLLAQAAITFPSAQANLLFAANTQHGPLDHTFLAGTRGSCESRGPSYKEQELTIWHGEHTLRPRLEGCWFSDGFRGTMGELLLSIEEGRQASIHARNNLASLALCFAAIASADSGKPIVPGTIRRLGEG